MRATGGKPRLIKLATKAVILPMSGYKRYLNIKAVRQVFNAFQTRVTFHCTCDVCITSTCSMSWKDNCFRSDRFCGD